MQEDVWIPSACSICYSYCPIKVRRVNGVVKKIEGNKDCPTTDGRLCPRGVSGIMLLYDPSRVNFPLKRTNSQKGIGIDPGWVRISWDEALDIIVARLKKIRGDDPRKLMVTSTVVNSAGAAIINAFISAFGTPNYWLSAAGAHCGKGEHLMGAVLHASWARQPDTNYMNYYLNFGCPSGFGAYYSVNAMAQRMADARVRGMRHVVIDPWMSPTAEKADEWIPIRPGTDAALALAMINVLLNELGIYDAESLKRHTNGPYLIGPDGYYMRDKDSGKPLVYDALDERAKVYDDPTIKDFALEGEYRVNGVSSHPAFLLVKEHVKKYTPEMAAKITSVPEATIRRLAREFGTAARVGSTIVIDGKELPYRPVGVGYFKGAQGHRHSALTCMALELLGEIVGASNVPGAILGMNSLSLGFASTGRPFYTPRQDADGLLVTGCWAVPTVPYPPANPRKPEVVGLQDLIPTTTGASPLVPWGILEREKFQVPYKPEFNLHLGSNYLMTAFEPELVASAFKDIFTVSFSLYLDESSELSDLVLPDACYLERFDTMPDWMANGSPLDYWAYHIRQPVVSPLYERRPAQQVLLEIADRLDILKDVLTLTNQVAALKPPFTLDPEKKYLWEEIIGQTYKSYFGPDHGLDWFKKNGVLAWSKKVEEVYWRPFVKARVPIYFEFLKKVGEQIEQVKRECAISGFDTEDFQPLPDWKPCRSHQEVREDYDLFAIYYRVPLHTFSWTYNNPWLDEASKMDPYVYNIAINAETGRRKGIKDGDWVDVESIATGHKVWARARLTEAIHPEVIAVANCGGHWAKHLPIASQPGKGVCFEWLMPLSFDYLDTVTLNLDLCVRVKVTPSEGEK